MQFLQEALKNLPQAAQNPLAFVAYLAVIIAWVIIAWRVKRNRQLLAKIQDFPKEERQELILAEMETPIPPHLSAEEWLKSRRQRYFLYAFVALCVAFVIVVVIAIVQPPPKDLVRGTLEQILAVPVSEYVSMDSKLQELAEEQGKTPEQLKNEFDAWIDREQMGKIRKSLDRRVHDLKVHLSILQDALKHVETDNIGYYKVMAASLRVLVCRRGSNIPLLIDIAEELNLSMKVTMQELQNVDGEIIEAAVQYTLEDYLKKTAFGSSGRPVSRIKLIRMVAEQNGLVHEDTALDSAWRTGEAIFKDKPYFIWELTKITENVLSLGNQVITIYEQRKRSLAP